MTAALSIEVLEGRRQRKMRVRHDDSRERNTCEDAQTRPCRQNRSATTLPCALLSLVSPRACMQHAVRLCIAEDFGRLSSDVKHPSSHLFCLALLLVVHGLLLLELVIVFDAQVVIRQALFNSPRKVPCFVFV